MNRAANILATKNCSDRADPLLSVRAIEKRFRTKSGDEVHALNSVSVDLADGEFVSVLGPSGCGKTTLLKILAGIVPPSDGTLLLRNAPIVGPQAGMGVVFQSSVLLPWWTVLENVLLPIRVLKRDLAQHREKARELLALVGLQGFESSYPGELSGGMQQRAAIVRGLIHDPGILLMDEPFGALDAMTRERMNVELQRIWMSTGKTVFFITHSVSEAVFLSDRVLVMSKRPGTLIDDIKVPFPRPRNVDLMSTAEFGDLTRHLRHALGGGEATHD
ncbi:MAG TPA: ABC transporter ATP-binding protein [Pseudolabrys sp.]|nr:ABC transporter ATP-binding protein [Pseudolabrys sp.]